ncbi:MAG: hypothetical protein ACUZ77_03255 [Candidatus Brocadiales bacterium]
MARYERKFFNIVFLGSLNPAILTHDFLLSNDIIPKDQEPFKSLLQNEPGKQVSRFISTPVMATIQYDKYSILVEEQRYQITDLANNLPYSSPIIPMTKAYFGKVLKYTPLKAGGFNFHGTISFGNKEEERGFDENIGLKASKAAECLSAENVQMSTIIRYPLFGAVSELQVIKSKGEDLTATMNHNFEFKFTNMDEFINRLDQVKEVYEQFLGILCKLKLEVAQ